MVSSPTLSSDGATVYVGSQGYNVDSGNGKVYALKTSDGTERWSVATGNAVYSPALSSDGATTTSRCKWWSAKTCL